MLSDNTAALNFIKLFKIKIQQSETENKSLLSHKMSCTKFMFLKKLLLMQGYKYDKRKNINLYKKYNKILET